MSSPKSRAPPATPPNPQRSPATAPTLTCGLRERRSSTAGSRPPRSPRRSPIPAADVAGAGLGALGPVRRRSFPQTQYLVAFCAGLRLPGWPRRRGRLETRDSRRVAVLPHPTLLLDSATTTRRAPPGRGCARAPPGVGTDRRPGRRRHGNVPGRHSITEGQDDERRATTAEDDRIGWPVPGI